MNWKPGEKNENGNSPAVVIGRRADVGVRDAEVRNLRLHYHARAQQVQDRMRSNMAQINPLRPITQRLTSTPVTDLPHIACFLASSIAKCSQILQTASSQASTKDTDNAVLVHKLKTRVSSLLQDRSHEGRFTAVVLIKAIVEAGGRKNLSSCEPWIRGLIAILGKNDSTATKKLSMITITRIFLLTQRYPTLVREITTPLLPSFVTICLNLIKPTTIRTEGRSSNLLSPFLETAFKCLLELIPHHPTIFRPFVPRFQPIALSLIATASTPLAITNAASDVLTALHFSASKNSAATEWSQAFRAVISSCHGTVDRIFRGFIEDWEPSEQTENRPSVNKNYDSQVQGVEADPYGLSKWVGIHSGVLRVIRELSLLKSFLSNRTAQLVSCNLGSIVDLTARLTFVAALMDAKGLQFSARLSGEVGREEREELWAELPAIHIAVLDLLSAVIESFSRAAIPIARPVFAQAITVFKAEYRVEGVRVATYRLIDLLSILLGSSMTKSDVKELATVVKSCCADLTQGTRGGSVLNGSGSRGVNQSRPNGVLEADADAFIQTQNDNLHGLSPREFNAAYLAAFRLLPCFLCTLPADVVPHSLRTEIDRTAILAQHQRAMLASVLNPPPVSNGRHAVPSIMPFLSRAANGGLDLEALLRPRMPIVRSGKGEPDAANDMSDDETEDEDLGSQNAQEPPETDLLDRLENSLDTSPTVTRDGDDVLYSEAVSEEDARALKSTLELDNAMKRSYASLDNGTLLGGLGNGTHDVADMHLTTRDPNKKRRLDMDRDMIETGDPAGGMKSQGFNLQPPSLQIAAESAPLKASMLQQTDKVADIAPAPVAANAVHAVEDDSESDFEIPQINTEMSSSEEDEEV